MPNVGKLNALLRERIARTQAAPGIRRSHYFHGRYENLVLPREWLPEIESLLTFVEAAARQILRRPPTFGLRTGFWFNLMRQGHVTTRHTHDEDDELLSAVYYVSVPPDSGDLILYPSGGPVRVHPFEGRLILFQPDLPHEVSENRSGQPRLSIGMNLGPG